MRLRTERVWKLGIGLAAVSALAAGSRAQTATPAARPVVATGTVTGHVYCNDTQRPARFADVSVLRETAAATAAGPAGAVSAAPNYQEVGRGRTALDGSFVVTGVPAGDYYVMASETGYVSPLTVARMTGKAIARVPFTHVDAGRAGADVTVAMDRGAVVTGRVTYDDGSPVAGVPVRLRALSATDAGGGRGGFPGFFGGGDNGSAVTDDRGVYRASGIAPGKYVAVATVQTETTGGRGGYDRDRGRGGYTAPISVYAPATQHKTEARVVDIRGGETVQGADIAVALAGLHSVRGSVESKADAHLLNSGYVTLVDATDGSFSRTATVGSDGAFFVEYLPPGSYTLNVSGADRSGTGRDSETTKRYVAGTATVVVGEHDVAVDPVMLAEAGATGAR